jgi:hypothetical protein
MFAANRLPEPPTLSGLEFASASVKGSVLYVVGGESIPGPTPSAALWLYTVPTDIWAAGMSSQSDSALGICTATMPGLAGASVPTARSFGCLASVGNNLFYSGASGGPPIGSASPALEMRALEMIVGTAAVTSAAPTNTPTNAPTRDPSSAPTTTPTLNPTSTPTVPSPTTVAPTTPR